MHLGPWWSLCLVCTSVGDCGVVVACGCYCLFDLVSCFDSFCDCGRSGLCRSPGHANKNTGGQLSSCLRTLLYGDYFCDMVAAREHGLPPAAFGRSNPMSDSLQAILMNPFYLVKEVAPCLFFQEPFASFCNLLYQFCLHIVYPTDTGIL